MSEPINDDWSIIGTVEAGFDPISGELANSQRSQVMNNGNALSCRARTAIRAGPASGITHKGSSGSETGPTAR